MTRSTKFLNAKSWRPYLVLLAILVAALSAPGSVRATNMTVRAGTVSGAPGKTVEVPIEALGAPDVGAMQLRMVYDPAVLSAEAVAAGPLLGGALLESNLDSAGLVVIAVATTDGIRGDGALAKVRFKVVGKTGQSSEVRLEEVKAWERQGDHLDVLVESASGQVAVEAAGGNSWLLWALIAAAALLVVGLGVWWSKQRRRPAPAAAAGGAAFCVGCGTPLSPGARFCRGCGRQT